MKMQEMTYKDAIRLAMVEEMRADENVIFMGEDIGLYGGAFGVSVGMLEEFGEERVRDTPISEAVIVGAAAGAAVTGLRVIAEIMFMDFTTIGMDQLVNQAAKMRYMFGGKARVPMVLRCPGGSGTGAAAQHSQALEAWFTHIPGLKVVVPSTANDARALLKAAIRDDNPVVFVEQKTLYKEKGEVNVDPDYVIELGKGEIKKVGEHVSVVTYGRMLPRVMNVAKRLEEKGISVEVIDPRTLVPLDKELIINSVKKTGRVLLVNEACKNGGYIGEIAAMIAESEAFDYLDYPIRRLAGKDIPIPYNPELEKAAVPSEEEIEAQILEMVR